MPEVGQHIGPFILDRWLSSTPEYSLFYAKKPEGTRTLGSAAIRILNSSHQEERLLGDLQEDFDLLQAIEHHSFPKVYHNYLGQQAYARQWIEGVTLQELITAHQDVKVTLDMPTILDIMLELAHALKYIHEQRVAIIHGRLNLSHILIDDQGHLYIIGLRTKNKSNTPSFSSPEQAANAFVDWRTDQWAMGAILIELLLKEPLYTGRQNPQYSAERGDALHWIRRIETLWPQLKPFLRRVLHPAAGERFQNDSELIKGLMQIIKQVKGQSQRHIIGMIANDLAKGKMDTPPVLTKIPPITNMKGPNIATAVLPPIEPRIIFDEESDLTDQFEPLLNEPHIEHPDHTSPQIPIDSAFLEIPEKSGPIVQDFTPKPIREFPAQKFEESEESSSYEEVEYHFEESNQNQHIAYALIIVNGLTLTYLILQALF
jgi:serine/threonine protein kinase